MVCNQLRIGIGAVERPDHVGGGVGQQNGGLVAQCLYDESASASVLIVGPLQEKFSPCILGESCVSLESYVQAN